MSRRRPRAKRAATRPWTVSEVAHCRHVFNGFTAVALLNTDGIMFNLLAPELFFF